MMTAAVLITAGLDQFLPMRAGPKKARLLGNSGRIRPRLLLVDAVHHKGAGTYPEDLVLCRLFVHLRIVRYRWLRAPATNNKAFHHNVLEGVCVLRSRPLLQEPEAMWKHQEESSIVEQRILTMSSLLAPDVRFPPIESVSHFGADFYRRAAFGLGMTRSRP